jgi:hypothetical protein
MLKTVFFTLVLGLSLLSCRQERKQEESTKSQILEALNRKDLARAEVLIDQAFTETPDDIELTYFRAQLFSLKANIDVYSLFPILKMKLFEVAIHEWSQYKKYNELQGSATGTVIMSEGNLEKKEKIENDIAKISQLDEKQIEYKVNFDAKKVQIWNGETCYFPYSIDYNLFGMEFKLSASVYPLAEQDAKISNLDSCIKIALKNLESQVQYFDLKHYALSILHSKLDNLKQQHEAQRVFNAAIGVFDSMPIIRNIPDKAEDRLLHIKSALVLLEQVIAQNSWQTRLGKNSRQQTALLAGYLILSALKESLRVEEIAQPIDVLCQLDPTILVKNYKTFLLGTQYLNSVIIGTELEGKNSSQIEELNGLLKIAPAELTEEYENLYIERLTQVQDNAC